MVDQAAVHYVRIILMGNEKKPIVFSDVDGRLRGIALQLQMNPLSHFNHIYVILILIKSERKSLVNRPSVPFSFLYLDRTICTLPRKLQGMKNVVIAQLLNDSLFFLLI
jgi:hypothetical protein